MALEWSAEQYCLTLLHYIQQDALPSVDVGVFFGMGSVQDDAQLNGSLDQAVFGTWQMMCRHGLLRKPQLLEAIRSNSLQSFFMDGAAKLAFNGGAGYAMRALRGKPVFASLPALAADPPLNLEIELGLAAVEALDAVANTRFQTEATQKAAWDRADDLAAAILATPERNHHNIQALKNLLVCYNEAERFYGASRKPPTSVVEAVAFWSALFSAVAAEQ